MKARFDYAELQRKDISNKITKILLEKQAEIEAAKVEAASQQVVQPPAADAAWNAGQQSGQHNMDKTDGKRRKHGKICFSCYEQQSYHGQGTCSNHGCPLNGGPSPYQGLDALKLNVENELTKLFAQMKLYEQKLDEQGHEVQVLANRVRELEV